MIDKKFCPNCRDLVDHVLIEGKTWECTKCKTRNNYFPKNKEISQMIYDKVV